MILLLHTYTHTALIIISEISIVNSVQVRSKVQGLQPAKLSRQNFVKFSPNLDNFWQNDGKEARIMRGALIFHLT